MTSLRPYVILLSILVMPAYALANTTTDGAVVETPAAPEAKSGEADAAPASTSTVAPAGEAVAPPQVDAAAAGATSEATGPSAELPGETSSRGMATGASVTAVVTPAPPSAPVVAAAPPPPPPPPTLMIDVDLSTQRMVVTENGEVKHSWAISSARPGYRTPTGTFKPAWMAKMWYSRQYDMSPMPHSIFFSGGAAIHATRATGMLGRPASHGCVRLAPGNAAALFKLVGQHGKDRTRIVVHGAPNHRSPAVAKRSTRGPRYGAAGGYRYVPGYYSGTSPSGAYMRPSGSSRTRRTVTRSPYSPFTVSSW